MRVLMPLNQKLIDKISKKNVKYIYKRRIFTYEGITTILLYSTSPIKKIVGEIKIGNILYNTPETLWKLSKKYSSLSEKQFFKYFNNVNKGYALKIESIILYPIPKSLSEYGVRTPPQSFRYIFD